MTLEADVATVASSAIVPKAVALVAADRDKVLSVFLPAAGEGQAKVPTGGWP